MAATAVTSVTYQLAGRTAAGNNTFRQIGSAPGAVAQPNLGAVTGPAPESHDRAGTAHDDPSLMYDRSLYRPRNGPPRSSSSSPSTSTPTVRRAATSSSAPSSAWTTSR
ncbi:hypothetical protein [Streptomyces sp. 4F14]|uniref:hypothetical protein n=1 Tax=Streptomyces sp. 4F14 TaxID=3394380 RepID=UPI003A8392B1